MDLYRFAVIVKRYFMIFEHCTELYWRCTGYWVSTFIITFEEGLDNSNRFILLLWCYDIH